MFTPWMKPWWHAHVMSIGGAIIFVVIAFIVTCKVEKKKALRLRQQRKRARKTYQDHYTIKIRGRKNVGQANEN